MSVNTKDLSIHYKMVYQMSFLWS